MWQMVTAHGNADAMMCVFWLALQRYDRVAAETWVEPLLAPDQPYSITALGSCDGRPRGATRVPRGCNVPTNVGTLQ